MFNFFKRKKESSSLARFLELDDAAFVSSVKIMLEDSHPTAWTMCVVAYPNLQAMLQACEELSRDKMAKDVPGDLDSLIRMLSVRLEKQLDEMAQRRLVWFLQASLILKATEIALRKSELQSDTAALWVMLARGAEKVSEILPQNILWSEAEKAFFSNVKTPRDGAWYCLEVLMPPFLKKDEHLAAFAKSRGILLFSL